MADRLMRAQVTIPLDSNIPDDSIVNTFYFDQDDNGILPPPATSYAAVMDSLTDFYQLIDDVIYPSTVGAQAVVRIYDMRDAKPRVLRHEGTIDLTPSVQGPLPGEVALCLSFAADYEAGVNPARRRGRVYLGPLHAGCLETVGSQAMFQTGKLDDIIAAGNSLLAPENVDGSSLSWAMYSPTTDAEGANIDDSFFDVQRIWVDNALDTQRRRGASPTVRLTSP